MQRALALWVTLGLGLLGTGVTGATEVKIFKTETRAGFLNGEAEGVAIDPLGRLELADRVDRLTAVDEPFVLSMAPHPEGWVLGTGNAGRVLLVTRSGEVRQLFEAPEPQVFAVWAADDGTVYAGTSPRGRVYRIPAGGGEASPWFDPGEVYIWDFAVGPAVELLIATGTQGRLYGVPLSGTPGAAESRLLYDTEDTHVRSLAVTDDGRILLGTAGEGLILALSSDGRARTLYDGDAPEVAALAAGEGGVAYAALVASEASMVDLSGNADTSAAAETETAEADSEGSATVESDAGTLGSRRAGFGGPRTTVVTVLPGGTVEPLAELADETVFSMLWQGDRLWLGTGLEGKLYTVSPGDGQPVLEKDVDERQIVALVNGPQGPAFATTNAAAVYRAQGGSEARGVYVSDVLDAGQIARFGTFRWRGAGDDSGDVRFSFRSGMSREPDRTWSDWTPWKKGSEVSLADLPRGRYVQWRAELTASGGERGRSGPILSSVELSYLQDNLAPVIKTFEVLDAGQVLVPSNFNPGTQTYEAVSPNREGIFTRLESAERESDGRLKELWRKGWRTLRWTTEDPNEDEISARLDFVTEENGDDWLPVADDLDEGYYSFDATALPDGVYRFRLTVSDDPGNRAGEERGAQRISEPVVVDHTAPRLVSARGRSARVEDALSPILRAEVSVDAGEWRDARTEDGLLDGRGETFVLEAPEGARLVLLRVMDAAFNVVTFDLSSGGAAR